MSDFHYYLFFAGLMFVVAIIFVFVAMAYRGRTYIQHSEGESEVEATAVSTG